MRLDQESDQEALLEVLEDYFYSRKPKKSSCTSEEYYSSDSDRDSSDAEIESEDSDDDHNLPLQDQGKNNNY